MTLQPTRSHAFFEELLYLERDGLLSAGERQSLARHVAGCTSCRVERRAVERLDELLASARVDVDADFTTRVLAALPEAGWEARAASGLRLAAGVFLLLGLGAAVIGLGGAGVGGEPLAATISALVGLFGSALVAGAGLLTASWMGLGLALGDLFRDSPVALAAFGVLVLGIDILVVRLVLRRRRAGAERRTADLEPPPGA